VTSWLYRSRREGRRLSRELRRGRDPALRRRRGIVGLILGAMGCIGLAALYQTGVIRHLPEPRVGGGRLDADRVDAYSGAYRVLSVPDSVLAIASYAVTLALAAAGGIGRGRRHPWLPVALAAKLTADGAMGAALARVQWKKIGAFCSWCLVATGATLAALPLALPDAGRALASGRAGRGS
jgi:Vitamin K epoxide reductase family